MYLYDLDTKITNKSYQILSSHIENQKQLNLERVSEIRVNCKNILQKNGIFEDKKNGVIYQLMENELANLVHNIDYLNEYSFEEITKNKIDIGIDNVAAKIDSLENKIEFIFEDDNSEYYNKASSENSIKNMLFTYFESYKNNTVNLLTQFGYSQNTIDDIENDILEYVTSKSSDVLVEKIFQDRAKGLNSLSSSLDELSIKMVNEAESRYICKLNGEEFDELKEKREIVRNKAKQLEDIRKQIANIDLKASDIMQASSERVLL